MWPDTEGIEVNKTKVQSEADRIVYKYFDPKKSKTMGIFLSVLFLIPVLTIPTTEVEECAGLVNATAAIPRGYS